MDYIKKSNDNNKAPPHFIAKGLSDNGLLMYNGCTPGYSLTVYSGYEFVSVIFVQPARVSFRLYLLLFVLVYAGARTFEGPGFPVYLSVYKDHADTAQFGGKFPGNAFIQFCTGS